MAKVCGPMLLLAAAVTAAEPAFDRGPVFTMIEENDLFVKTDRHYTQGIKLSYMHSDGFLPLGSQWVYDKLPEVGFASESGRLGYSVGQNIYTPANIKTHNLQTEDRPYAGWLYLGAILQRRGWSLGERLTEEDIEFEAGVIGHWALAGEAQKWVHHIRDFPQPHGWKHQLDNEPGVRLKYSRGVRLYTYESDGLQWDFTPRIGGSAGNVDTSARVGGMVRLGFNLPDDFGMHTIDSLATTSGGISKSNPQPWSVYVFAGCEGRAVFFTQFLDGDMYHDSHEVQKEWLVGEANIGFVLAYKQIELGYAHTFRTPEFSAQTEHDSYGSVFLKARF